MRINVPNWNKKIYKTLILFCVEVEQDEMQLLLHLEWKIDGIFPKQVWNYYLSKVLKKYFQYFEIYSRNWVLKLNLFWTPVQKEICSRTEQCLREVSLIKQRSPPEVCPAETRSFVWLSRHVFCEQLGWEPTWSRQETFGNWSLTVFEMKNYSQIKWTNKYRQEKNFLYF